MKKNKIIFAVAGIAFSIAILMNGCKEVGPIVPWGNNGTFKDTTYVDNPVQTPQQKNALIEEITGVSCVNCPSGHVVLDNLIASTNYHVVGVSYHVGTQMLGPLEVNPPGWRQNLVSTDAQTIVNYFGNPGTAPEGAVDRIIHNDPNNLSGPSIWDTYNNWGGYVTTELSPPTAPVNLYVSSIYNSSSSTRQVTISVGIHYTSAQPDTDKLSIFLTEDSIITSQLLAGNSGDLVDTNYVHNHIMRAAVTNPLGNIINVPSFAAGRVDSLVFTYALTPADSLWNPAHMHVVAFVHKYQHGNSNVLQAQIVPLIP